MLRLLAWLVVAVLLGAAAFELALALGAGSIGPQPGDNVAGADWVKGAALLAMLTGAAIAPRVAPRSLLAAALLAPSAAAVLVAFVFTYDPYYAPSLRRYHDVNASLGWIVALAALAVGAGVATRLRPREGALATTIVLLVLAVATLLAGDGH